VRYIGDVRWLIWGGFFATAVVACATGNKVDPPDPTGTGGATSASSSVGGASGGAGGEGGSSGELGSACDDGTACDSGFCADGVCCASECTAICATCDGSGQCVGHPAGMDPEQECLGATCDGAKACDYAAHRWSRGFGDLVEEQAGDVAVGPNGEVVLVGSYYGTIDFGGGPLTATIGQDIYVAKLDALGNHVWSKSFGNVDMNPSGFFGSQFPGAVTLSSTGHIFITGVFSQDITFGGPTLEANSLDLFIVELDENGDYVQSKVFYASSPNGTQRIGNDIAVDASGNVLVTGMFTGDINFDGTVVDDGAIGANRSTFVVKLNPSLTTLWAGSHGSSGSEDIGRAIVASVNNEVVVCGSMTGSMSFGAINLTTTGPRDAFLARFDTNGNALWAKRLGGLGADRCRGLVALNGGDVAMVGSFEDTVSFGGADLVSLGGSDAFVVRLTGAGNEVWSKALRGPGSDEAFSVARGSQDSVLVSGGFAATLSTGADFLTAEGPSDIFVARFLESTGAAVWARRYGGAGADMPPVGLSTSSTGDVVITGTLASELSLGGNPIANAGVTDVYVGSWGP